MIVLNDLYTGYSRNSPLLEGFNYQFNKKIYGILGESGCGKTTLLRTIAGLAKPLQGEVVINGAKENRPNKNGIYMLHQNYTSFDWMTCLDNVLIAKKVKGRVTEKDKDNALKMLELVKLDEHVHKYPRQLSGGMRQRLALARTLFMQPQIILMDEPLSALDSVTRAEMQKLIIRMQKGINNTIIMVTHSTDEAEKMCDEIIKL
ncbi:ATP-binding cassette domain-containing protein [Acetatifactor muris]|uniref:Sulfate/thiosulfate import ATP-binding protein CysA n=1 Tax=Acetatifactor muris TaxID=879566 RepID=A0A2K4ZQ27_9FIRM|nr:ATP-binding cassette domain-containing protein [Acetatifactor muris]MCR2051069.1 ATP-binding cassette domain-containing protein [Acetatifactor muris]SOY32601.1 Sulfate/thiosulfate import ATP-binding protein CysA [Acetatifactor muris]